MTLSKEDKILIVGLGLIGGSYAIALKSKGFYVGGIDTDANAVDYAVKNGMVNVGSVNVSKEFIEEFNVIIFAVYPNVLIDWVKNNQQYIKNGTLLTDITGVKRSVVYSVQETLRQGLEFIGAHPMAGREVSGVRNARGDLFIGANYIVTPTDKNTESAITLAKNIGEVLGCRRISILTPEEHDEMIGFLSQLTHCIAVSLMTCKDSKNLVDYTGDSFRDLTRIAKINEKLWSELFSLNKDLLLKEMQTFLYRFNQLKTLIENDDISGVEEMMKLSTIRREYFDK